MNSKKIYITPKVDAYQLDNEICLIMQSTPPGDPPGGFSVAPTSAPEYPTTLKTESPFGGSSPDYENL